MSRFHCNQCIIHHVRFCPVNLRLISCSALGSLDTSSGGTQGLPDAESILGPRGSVLVFIRRLNVFDPADV